MKWRSRNLYKQHRDRVPNSVDIRRILRFSLAFLAVALGIFTLWQAQPSFSQSNSPVNINEIMYNPTQNENYNEWVEIRNISPTSIDLASWTLCGKELLVGYVDHVDGQVRSDNGLVLGAGGYALITDGGSSGTEVYSNFDAASDSLAVHVDVASICGGLTNTEGKEKELVLSGNSFSVSVKYQISWGGGGNGKSVGLDQDGAWKEAEPTPGRANEFPVSDPPPTEQDPPPGEDPPQDQGQDDGQQQPQPAVNFSSPSSVSVDAPFSVSVTLNNFDPGTYSIKVLIGKGDKFYDGRTKGTGGKWLAWNAGWADFPKVTVGSSGSASKTVQAKTDSDVVAGSYLVKIRAHRDNDGFDSETKPLKVVRSTKPESTSRAADNSDTASSSVEVGGGEPSFAEATEDKGEAKGEEAPREESSKLNFYVILGAFGLLVGSGGFILAFRRGARRPRTANNPELEQDLP